MAQSLQSIDLKINPVINLATVRPGDTLVVAVNLSRPLSEQEAEEIRDRLQLDLPGVRIVPVVASALAVYRPDKEYVPIEQESSVKLSPGEIKDIEEGYPSDEDDR